MSELYIEITADDFITDFSEFAEQETEVVELFIKRAGCYISTYNYGVLRNDCRKLAIEYMTAHLLTLNNNIKNGNTTGGQVASTSIDKVSVSLTPPPTNNLYQYWLGQTTYGLTLLALLKAKAPAGVFSGGIPQRVLR